MSKATDKDLGRLHGAIARGLTEVIENGELVTVLEDGQEVRKTASAAFFMAGITLLKNNNITSDVEHDKDIRAMQEAMERKRKGGKQRLQGLDDAVKAAAEHLDHQLGGLMQ